MFDTLETQHYFAPDYGAAREKFLAACRLCDLPVESWRHPLNGADGAPLFTDVARIGPRSARHVLVLTSGVHGPELMAGSGCQVGWLLRTGGKALPPDTAAVLVHAINPWGAAHLRRYTDGNVDLCRNYVDFSQDQGCAQGYEALHPAVVVDPRDTQAVIAADAVLARFQQEHGTPALYAALMAGQYRYPDGMGYGGAGPDWSRVTMERILQEHAGTAERVSLVDYHTGLGAYSYGCVVALQNGAALERVRRVFGEWVLAPLSTTRVEDKVPVTGHTTPGYERILPQARVMALVLEYGTYSQELMLELLLADHRQTFGAARSGHVNTEARQGLLRFFYPDDARWKRAVFERSQQVVAQAVADLSQD